MRRAAAVLTTSLLASAAALTAPAAQAAPSAVRPAAAGCSTGVVADSGVGTCSGIDPRQTWSVMAQCQYWNGPVLQSWSVWSREMVGDGTAYTTGCGFHNGFLVQPSIPRVAFGGLVPPPPVGPKGQITGYAAKCVDVAGGRTGNGAPVQIYDCNGTAAQQWTVATDGALHALGKCMDVQGGGTADHTLVQLYDCNGSGAQQWKPRPDGSLLNPQSGRCLDDLGFGTGNGNQLGIWDCNGLANQKWHLPG
ncbi:ricin-type beta-trefoil lectin domain protein [Kitasatospora sp. HPMI-4]|uniref:ricin-type beta-trefoil lectin domain protein n=1 Tax=Kitasatospora sp. HPMI-4 TaxID=3448443 RepID=UPI003F19D9F0